MLSEEAANQNISTAVERIGIVVDRLEQASAGASPRLVAKIAPALDQAVNALKSLAEIEKSRAETRKIRAEEERSRYDLKHIAKHERSDARQRYVGMLTPVITTLVLVLTLLAQTWQFSQSERDKENAAEDSRWSAAVKTISETAKMSPIAIELNPFLKSKRYAEDARRTAVQALVSTQDSIVFADLFREAFVPVDWKNLGAVLQLDRALGPQLGKLYDKTYDPKTQTNNNSLLTPEETQKLEYITSALLDISRAVTPLLTDVRPPNQEVDLRGTWFRDCNWSGVNLRNANIENLDLRYAILKGADLSGITSFKGVYLYRTAWWEANRISPALLEHLIQKWPYQDGFTYGPSDVEITRQEYNDAIARLTTIK